MTTPITEPTCIVAGDSLLWQKTLTDYPASAGWGLTYTLINKTAKIQIVCTASGDSFNASATHATTATYAAGDYTMVGKVSKGSEVYTVFTGQITVNPDLSALPQFDGRSTAKQILEALKEKYKEYVAGGSGHIAEYEIAGRKMKFRSAGEIIEQIDYWQAEVFKELRQERASKGLNSGNSIKVRLL